MTGEKKATADTWFKGFEQSIINVRRTQCEIRSFNKTSDLRHEDARRSVRIKRTDLDDDDIHSNRGAQLHRGHTSSHKVQL